MTARLSNVSSEMTTVTVSATGWPRRCRGTSRLRSNKTLMIMAGQLTSTGTVTITANDNDVDTPDKDGAGFRDGQQQSGGDRSDLK